MRSKRDVVRTALLHERPLYVPWSFDFTQAAEEKLRAYYGTDDQIPVLDIYAVSCLSPSDLVLESDGSIVLFGNVRHGG